MPGDDERGGGGEGEGGTRPPPFPPGMGDPFRDVRGEGPEGDLMGPASLGLCCAVCCVCTMMSLLIAYLAWAYWTVATSQASASTECGTSYSLWVFCLTVTILVPILGCIVSIITYFTQKSGLQVIPGVINLAMAVWGMVLWSSMDSDCTTFYDRSYPDLFLLFKISVVLLSITFFIFLCVVCVGAAFLGGAIASDGFRRGDGYQNVPGESGGGGGGGGQGQGGKEEALRTAARYGRVEEVETLLRGGANVQAKDESDDMTALHYAALGGHAEVAKRLVNAGANIDAETKAGDTPLRLAMGKSEVENFLRSCGARDSMASAGADAATEEFV